MLVKKQKNSYVAKIMVNFCMNSFAGNLKIFNAFIHV